MRHVLPSLTSGVSLNRMWVSVNVICSLNRMWVSVNAICVCYEPSSLLHWSLLLCTQLLVVLASASSICLVYLSFHAILKMSSTKILPCLTFNYCSTRGISAPSLIISSISRSWVSTHLQFDARCFPHVLSAVIHSGLRANEMLWSVSWCLGSHGSNILCFSPCPQGVSPSTSIYSLPLCFSLVRWAFLHQFGLSIAHHHSG